MCSPAVPRGATPCAFSIDIGAKRPGERGRRAGVDSKRVDFVSKRADVGSPQRDGG